MKPDREWELLNGTIIEQYGDTIHVGGVSYNLHNQDGEEWVQDYCEANDTVVMIRRTRATCNMGHKWSWNWTEMAWTCDRCGEAAEYDRLNQEPCSVCGRNPVGYMRMTCGCTDEKEDLGNLIESLY